MSKKSIPTIKQKPSVLEVVWFSGSQAKENFPEHVVVTLGPEGTKGVDYHHDIAQPLPKELLDRFDVVFLPHIMEHFGRTQIVPVFTNLRAALKVGTGEIWAVVFALEKVYAMLKEDEVSPAVLPMLYGPDVHDNPLEWYRSAFTLAMLRSAMSMAKLTIRQAIQQPTKIRISGTEYEAINNFVIAARVAE